MTPVDDLAAAPADAIHRELVVRAGKLAPLLAEQAAEAERIRKPTDAVIRALAEAEIFKLMVPRCYGGFELDMDALFDVVAALAEGDASLSWVASFYIEHNWILCLFPEAFQRELFADRSYVLAPGMVSPSGKASRDGDTSFRLSGRWQWATGVMHCDWVIAGAIALPVEGAPDARWFAVPREQIAVEDTWHVDGMSGTGSNDVVIDDVWVPAERSVSIVEMSSGTAPGSRLHAGPLYRTPMVPVLATAAALPALGQARNAVRLFRERLAERTSFGSSRKQSEKPAAQIRLARAELEVREVGLLLRDAVDQLCELRDKASLEDRARLRAQIALAVSRCRKLIDDVCAASGASVHFQSHPLQRALRDVNTLSCHTVFDLDTSFELYGKLRLGQEPGVALV